MKSKTSASPETSQTQAKPIFPSLLYFFSAHMVTSFAVTYSQERLPDKLQYPPLTDIILDNIPCIPWAYIVTEIVIIVLLLVAMSVFLFHKYRLSVLRRYMVLTASMFYFRALCVVSTTLPAPMGDDDCQRLVFSNSSERLRHVFTVLTSFGLRIFGVRICGDYICSGQAIIIIMLVLSINEYSPFYMNYLHRLSWCIGVIGLVFIFLGKGHYTIDVLVAVVFSIWLFIYYNNQANISEEKSYFEETFPIFYFVKSNFEEDIPNIFEWTSN